MSMYSYDTPLNISLMHTAGNPEQPDDPAKQTASNFGSFRSTRIHGQRYFYGVFLIHVAGVSHLSCVKSDTQTAVAMVTVNDRATLPTISLVQNYCYLQWVFHISTDELTRQLLYEVCNAYNLSALTISSQSDGPQTTISYQGPGLNFIIVQVRYEYTNAIISSLIP